MSGRGESDNSRFSGPSGKVTNANLGEGVMWKPEKPSWWDNFPWFQRPAAQTALSGPNIQSLTPGFEKANAFVTLLRTKGPQAAYASVGAGEINGLFDAAVGYGLLDEGERESIWAGFNQPEQTGTGSASNTTTGGMGVLGSALAPRQQAPAMAAGTVTDSMIARAGGAINAYDNAWASGNLAEPQQNHFKSHADWKAAYQRWLDLH